MFIAYRRVLIQLPLMFGCLSGSWRFLGSLFLICAFGAVSSVAQVNCPAPWASLR
jgi:hypothetical protein